MSIIEEERVVSKTGTGKGGMEYLYHLSSRVQEEEDSDQSPYGQRMTLIVTESEPL